MTTVNPTARSVGPMTGGLDSWLTSTKHEVPPRLSGALPAPYGVRHARRVGETWTACGEPAADWRLFWLLPFQSWASSACAECSTLLSIRAGDRSTRNGPTSTTHSTGSAR